MSQKLFSGKFSSLQIGLSAIAGLILLLSFAVSDPKFAPLITLVAVAIFAIAFWRENGEKYANNSSQNSGEKAENESLFAPIRSNVTFKQVAGLKAAREELEEIVDYFKNPAKYKKFGVILPRGVLLSGPPGVGKTLIAKAVAGEAGVPFFYAGGSSFAQLYVGAGPKKVRELFASARKAAPSVVFIDEIDAVGKARGGARSDERENTLNQLLTEMDGFESAAGVVVLAATNRIEMLDLALLRPGRFDRRIEVGLPSLADREEILRIVFAGKKHELNLTKIAERTVGFSGAALATLANESALMAIRRGAAIIANADFEAIKDKVIGLKKGGEWLEEKDRAKLAEYQAAKAIAAKRLGLNYEAAKLGDLFLPDLGAVVGEKEHFALIAALLAGFVWWKDQGVFGLSFCEQDSRLARAAAARYAAIYEPLNLGGETSAIMDRAYKAAANAIDSASIAKLSAILLQSETAEFEVI
ncbi:MAG: AAA family ATPase [Helicobacteraceae bacterium]|jgi:ATP-dependent metalloprotease FtsH|nr:AAA family ATPase [Helicobacteraceae bacterium]